jgi:osmoprotectant transport system substrate-binding protein/osmoprotectant transport system permease protein
VRFFGRDRSFALAVIVSGALLCASARADGQPRLRIGSKRFTESYVLAEIAAEAARGAGEARVIHEQGLGGTSVVFRALEEGSIDVYPEYTGTLAEAVLHTPGRGDLPSLRVALGGRGIEITDPLGFDNTYALAVSPAVAARRHLATLSDLAGSPELRFGLSPEFLGRSDGFPALAARYGLSTAHVEAMDHGLAYDALARAAIDVADAYSTDAKIARYGLKVLEDDKRFFPSYEAVFLYRADAARRVPRSIEAIRGLAGTIDGASIAALNADAELDGRTFASIAEEFVHSRSGEAVAPPERRQGLLPGIVSVVRTEGPTHLMLVALSSLLATALGVPLGILARRAPRTGRFALGATSVLQTIPALAMLCFLIPLLGTGARPALLALFLYGLLPIVRNTVAGLDGIPPALRESAAALGLGPRTRLFRIELPLASRTILAGIRTSTVIAVGNATLAAFIGAGGFGAPITTGLNLDDTNLILEGAIPAALLALAVEGVFAVLDRTLIPRGLRLRAATQETR